MHVEGAVTDKVTADVIFLVTGLLVGFDIWTVLRRGQATTLSWTMHVWGLRWPIVAVAWGVLTGHFFWSQGCSP